MTQATPSFADTRGTLGYQPALDGLRAIAVVAVLLFHLDPDGVSGGFLGVSSFFTLSGFLITGLLLDELATRSTLDLAAFWARRVRRLAPAALVVVAVCVLATLTPWAGWGDGLLASEGVAGAWNVVNWHLITLDPARYPGPLGPFWSLGVEEQFYAVMAVGFMVLRRRPDRAARRLAITAIGVWGASLVVAVVLDERHPREMFGTDVRAAELAAGALLAIAIRRDGIERFRARFGRPGTARATAVGAIGWVAMALTVVAYGWGQEDQAWVLGGGFALLSLVHVAVITAAISSTSLARVLAAAPLVAVGKVSYALYLVQWPIILTLRADRLRVDGAALFVTRLIACAVAGVALHRLVEQPIRLRWHAGPRPTITAWLVGTGVISGLALACL